MRSDDDDYMKVNMSSCHSVICNCIENEPLSTLTPPPTANWMRIPGAERLDPKRHSKRPLEVRPLEVGHAI